MANQFRYLPEIILLLEDQHHWTAEQIHSHLKKHYPYIGIGSVYRNLDELVKSNKIKKLVGITRKVLYEANKPLHAHLYCHAGDMVMDLPLNDEMIKSRKLPDGFSPEEVVITIRGHFDDAEKMKCALHYYNSSLH